MHVVQFPPLPPLSCHVLVYCLSNLKKSVPLKSVRTFPAAGPIQSSALALPGSFSQAWLGGMIEQSEAKRIQLHE